MIPDRMMKTMLLELPIGPRFPLFNSSFGVDERGKNGKEKREGDRISERVCGRVTGKQKNTDNFQPRKQISFQKQLSLYSLTILFYRRRRRGAIVR